MTNVTTLMLNHPSVSLLISVFLQHFIFHLHNEITLSTKTKESIQITKLFSPKLKKFNRLWLSCLVKIKTWVLIVTTRFCKNLTHLDNSICTMKMRNKIKILNLVHYVTSWLVNIIKILHLLYVRILNLDLPVKAKLE